MLRHRHKLPRASIPPFTDAPKSENPYYKASSFAGKRLLSRRQAFAAMLLGASITLILCIIGYTQLNWSVSAVVVNGVVYLAILIGASALAIEVANVYGSGSVEQRLERELLDFYERAMLTVPDEEAISARCQNAGGFLSTLMILPGILISVVLAGLAFFIDSAALDVSILLDGGLLLVPFLWLCYRYIKRAMINHALSNSLIERKRLRENELLRGAIISNGCGRNSTSAN